MALGFILDDQTYMRDNWNRLDFFIVVVSIIDMALDGYNLGFMKVINFLKDYSFTSYFESTSFHFS